MTESAEKQRRFLGTDRSERARFSTRYSRFVGIMKFALPAAAVVLIALVVAWPESAPQRTPGGLALSGREGQSDLGMERVRYTGLNSDEKPFVVTAGNATPTDKNLDQMLLSDIQADMTLANGAWLTLLSVNGAYDRVKRTLDLGGKVDVFVDSGLEMHTPSAFVDFAAGRAWGREPVAGQGPFGRIEASGFDIFDSGERIVFTGRVKLTVYPAAS